MRFHPGVPFGIEIALPKMSHPWNQNGGQIMPEKQQERKSAADTAPTKSGNKEPEGKSPKDVEEGVTSKDATSIEPKDPIDPKSPKLVTP